MVLAGERTGTRVTPRGPERGPAPAALPLSPALQEVLGAASPAVLLAVPQSPCREPLATLPRG